MRFQSFFNFSVLFICTFVFTSCQDPDEVDLSSEKEIVSFSISDESTKIDLQINNNNSTISGDVPFNFNLEEVTTEITLSEGATISPDSGFGQNIMNQESYVVTAENGETKTYSLELTVSPNNQNFIVSFSVRIDDTIYDANIIDSEYHVKDTLPYFADLSNLSPVITVSDNATISPEAGVEQDFTNPVIYEVTAENGATQKYIVDIYREKSPENDLLEIGFDNVEVSKIYGAIDESSAQVILRVPSTVDLTNVIPFFQVSDRASVSSEISSGINLSSPYSFEVVAENGDSKNYIIQTEVMDINEDFSFEEGVASKWFGGDNRSSFGPRNIGTGQSITITENIHLQSFSVHFNGEFDYFENPDFNGHELEIILEIRSNDGSILASNSVVNPATFDGGWVTFDFHDRAVHLTNNTEYIFTWYLPNGFSNGYNSGSSGDADMGYTEGSGYSVGIESEDEDITDWSNWYEHGWDFWFRLEGLK
ncbi:hypothetical protein QYS48_17785 [Marivirga arenosa]|uniref:DUF5018 domain-containing protein n=1 Tax=Marivirga arenosa TaxID=3059076 RepID=A0AA49GDF0_9BACT|nr:hypothetical protein [Marivirga sp. ABR2-2]WKK84059.2 hypothetical protein QYS48_17785 [Marivirga sp. ABR2-2]